jgi:hypothetical protein
MDEVLFRLAALGRTIMMALFLYLCSQLFHAPHELKAAAKTPFQKVLVRVLVAMLGAVGLGSIMVIWTGV